MAQADPRYTPGGRPKTAPAGNPRRDPGYTEDLPPEQAATPQRMSVHEASRVKRAVESNVKAIENRIRFFQREEEKIWRDLEEVRRQAATIEEGRGRTMEKRMADKAISQAREAQENVNRTKAAAAKQATVEGRRQQQLAQMRAKQVAGQEQRRVSQDILRQKRMQEAQARLQNSEKAVAIQRSQLEARLKANQDKASRLEQLREEQEQQRIAAEMEVQQVESRLPQLEAEEMVCLQRLQNSRIVTQSVLEELESSLGARGSVTTLMRNKQKEHEANFEHGHDEYGTAEDSFPEAGAPELSPERPQALRGHPAVHR